MDDVSTDRADDRSNDGAASDSCTEVQEAELVVASSTEQHEVRGLEAVNKVTTDAAQMATQVTESGVTSEECSTDKAVVVDPDIEDKQQAGNDTSLTSPRAAVEPEEAEMSAVMSTAPTEVLGSEEATTKPVQHVSRDSRDEEMIVDDSQTEVAKVLSTENASVQKTENLTGATESRDVTDRAGSDGESTAQLVTAAGLPEVRHEDSEDNCDRYAGITVDVRQTDVPAADSEERDSLEKKENATDVASGIDVTDKVGPDNYTAQVMEMTDEPVSGTDEANESVKMMDVAVLDSEAVEESTGEGTTATVNIGNEAQHPEPLLTEKVMDDMEGRDVTDRTVGESATQLDMDIGVVVLSAEETQQTTQDAQQHTGMMPKADDVKDMPDGEVTEATMKAVTSEECALKLRDVSDNTETSQQSVGMIAETNNDDECVPECKEMTDMTVTDNAENAVTTDENSSQLREMKHTAVTDEQQNEVHTVTNDVALSDEVEDTDVLPKQSGTLTASVSSVGAQSVDKATDKVETAAEDTALIHSRGVLEKHTADCGKTDGMDMTGMELKTDETSIAGEIDVGGNVAEVHGGKSEQKKMVMAATLADDAAE